MRQIRTTDHIWTLPESVDADKARWNKIVNEVFINLKRRSTHRIMLTLNNYVEVVMHTNISPINMTWS